MEATRYWAWLHDQLTAAGIGAVAAHPYQVKLIWQARCKTDPIDARKLAELLRTNLLPTVLGPERRGARAAEAAARPGVSGAGPDPAEEPHSRPSDGRELSDHGD
jgi:transposase